jgi:antirestriction protein ArdC
MKFDLYTGVSARIVAELEAGAAPWTKPWSATPGANTPCNALTNRPYSGCNVVLLWMAQTAGYAVPRFLTFKQALELGGNVRKGERGTKVYFVKQLQVRDAADEAEATRVVPVMREYTVFNVDQCEKLPQRITSPGEFKPRNSDQRDATIDDFLADSGANIREGFGEAYYRPSDDVISLPRFEAFKNAAHFYSTAFHEMGHWTGHKSRLGLTIELDAKRLELLNEVTPNVRVIGALINANRPGVEAEEHDLLAAAKSSGRELVVLRTNDGPSIEEAFATLAKRKIFGILVGADALFNDHRQQVVTLAARYAMAGVYPWREYVTAGGLVSYGPSLSEGYRLSGLYVGRILKGEKPADLPVIQPAKFELAINLRTAKALGIDVPPTVISRADEVIE